MLSPGSESVDSGRKPYPEINNRRRRVRQKVHLPAYASLAGGSTGMVLDLSEVIDISEDGVCIQTATPLKPDSTLTLSLDLIETKAFISTTGKVIWSDRRGRNGITFPEISEPNRQQLKRWLFANAVFVGANANINADRQSSATAAVDKSPAGPAQTLRREARRESGKREFVKQSPEQTRAAIAASSKPSEVSLPADYSAVLTALVAVKREVEATGADAGKALQLLADRALSLTRATGAALAVAREQGTDQMTCIARAGSDAPGIGARLRAGSGFSGECVRTGRVLRCDDTETDPYVDRQGSRVLGIRSMVAAPIRQDDEVVGILEVFSRFPHSFGANDQKIMERLAEMAGAISRKADQAEVVSKTPPVEAREPNDTLVREAPAPRERQELQTENSVEPALRDREQHETEQTNATESTESPYRRILFAALALLVFGALMWLLIPGARKTNVPGASHAKSNAQAKMAKPISAADLATSDLDKLRKLAADGDPNAQFDLGARYATGEDVRQDYAESVRWFTQAAEQGHVIAQATLGAYYWAGRGIPQDLSKAYFWSLLAQAGGDEASKYRVAVLASRMPHSQLVAVQEQANDWLKAHQALGKNSE